MAEARSKWREPKAWLDAAYDPTVRAYGVQLLLVGAFVLLVVEVASNTAANLKKQNIASGFGFLDRASGFDISQTLIEYTSKSSYADVFWVGLLNTLVVAMLGIVLATALGFMIGLGRLSSNWLVRNLSLAYVEIVRNVPLLLQLLVWYVAVLRALPAPQESLALAGGTRLDVRGLHLPEPIFPGGSMPFVVALLVTVLGAIFLKRWADQRKAATGQSFPTASAAAGLFLILMLAALGVAGLPTFEVPQLGRFNFEGGITVEPEFLALLVGLVTYTAAFIAEIVRSGVTGVPKGQWEAANAIGLSRAHALRLVIIPQALRIIIPPLTNQYLNLTKNSSLAVAIGYPDLVSVFSGTVLNQTGQAVEVIVITMAVYLTLSLTTALIMNWFNARIALVER